MKTGICLETDKDVVLIDGTFQDGLLKDDAEVRIGYKDGRVAVFRPKSMRMEGFVMKLEDEIDRETNVKKSEKRLYSVARYANGAQVGSHWIFREDGIKIMRRTNVEESLIFVPGPNETSMR